MREQIDEQRPRLVSSTNRRECINVPEVAYAKGGLRGAETIVIRIAHDPVRDEELRIPIARARGGTKNEACFFSLASFSTPSDRRGLRAFGLCAPGWARGTSPVRAGRARFSLRVPPLGLSAAGRFGNTSFAPATRARGRARARRIARVSRPLRKGRAGWARRPFRQVAYAPLGSGRRFSLLRHGDAAVDRGGVRRAPNRAAAAETRARRRYPRCQAGALARSDRHPVAEPVERGGPDSGLPRRKLAFGDHSLVSVHLVFDSVPRAIALAEEPTDDFKAAFRGTLDAPIWEKLHRLANAVFVL